MEKQLSPGEIVFGSISPTNLQSLNEGLKKAWDEIPGTYFKTNKKLTD